MNDGYTVEVEIRDGPYDTIKKWNYAGLIKFFDTREGKAWGRKFIIEGELDNAFKTGIDHYGLCLIEIQIDRDDCNVNLLR
ncbi:MAG: hypothetical protein AAF636_22885 [Pseudomonadota bacterium]